MKNLIKMDDLGVPLFSETSKSFQGNIYAFKRLKIKLIHPEFPAWSHLLENLGFPSILQGLDPRQQGCFWRMFTSTHKYHICKSFARISLFWYSNLWYKKWWDFNMSSFTHWAVPRHAGEPKISLNRPLEESENPRGSTNRGEVLPRKKKHHIPGPKQIV